jgi:hypothetical protein
MENINGKSRASFRWILSRATIGLVVSISPCFAQGNRDASQETQRLGTALPEITPFKCDSLDPKVCFDIYWRLHNEPAQAEGGEVGYDYTLRPILFVVPRGDTAFQEARRKDAEALRARFTTCDSGLLFARSMRDVAVREPITKNSSDLVPALRQILDKTEVGHLTPPETTSQGIELFALCEKKETKHYPKELQEGTRIR